MPVQVYTSSPIRADGVTSKTTNPRHKEDEEAETNQVPATTTASQNHGYAAPAPGSVPSLPVQTATQTQPTPTGPPLPQPGAGPSYAPPPPAYSPHAPPLPRPGAVPSYAPQTYAHGTSTSALSYGGGPIRRVGGGEERVDHSHPPGYRQNAHAAEFNSTQRAAHDASLHHASSVLNTDESMWDVAKRWAAAAGDSIVAAENEIWRRINGN